MLQIDNLPRKESINRILGFYNHTFPIEFLRFLNDCDSCVVEFPDPPLVFEIYAAEEILEANEGLHMSEFLPNFFVFGGDRANELLTFKLDEPNQWAVFMTPMIVMSEEDSEMLADSFTEFLSKVTNVRNCKSTTQGQA